MVSMSQKVGVPKVDPFKGSRPQAVELFSCFRVRLDRVTPAKLSKADKRDMDKIVRMAARSVPESRRNWDEACRDFFDKFGDVLSSHGHEGEDGRFVDEWISIDGILRRLERQSGLITSIEGSGNENSC